jgi:hypothetical protein
MATAIDQTSPPAPSELAKMAAAGMVASLRYLSRNRNKNLSRAEAVQTTGAGIKNVVVWEAQGDDPDSFTAAQGTADAKQALIEATVIGIPKGACIYFCGDDFDASDEQIAGPITDYMTSVAPLVRAAGYRVGVYGNGAMCAHMLDNHLADLAWVWGSGKTNGTQAFYASNRWSIRQHPTVTEFGASVDPDDVQGDYGGFFVGTPPSAPAVVPPATAPAPAAATPSAIQTILDAENFGAAVVAFQEKAGLTADGVIGPATLKALAS